MRVGNDSFIRPMWQWGVMAGGAERISPSHIHGGDLLPFRDLSLFLSQLVLEA